MAEAPDRAAWGEREPAPLSALQHALYCLRQCALIHVEQAWEENRFTAEGRVLHAATDRQTSRKRRGTRVVTGLALRSHRLNLAGIADVVEFHGEGERAVPFPVEYKRGRPKLHRADEVQLCAQGLCLEEMTGRDVPEGALFYGETRRRVVVPFDEDLRRLTEETAATVHRVLAQPALPPAVYEARKCRACSLIDICRPRLAGRSARAFREREIADAVAELGEGEI